MKKLLLIAFAILIAFISLATFASCNNGGDEPCACAPSRDANNDCLCDICGQVMRYDEPCTPQTPKADEKK